MPGVPSGRGCEACRKQKKKCDQAKPACSRCARLAIACLGCGEQRYKFKQHSVVLRQSKKHEGELAAIVFRQPPTSQVSRTAAEFISIMQVDDLRYDISCYGPFFSEIPARLGHSEAVDTAATAICKTLRSYQTRVIGADVISAYGKALNALRATLMDPAKAHSIDTLFAIYMNMISQGWLIYDDHHIPNHGEGIAIILEAACHQGFIPQLGFGAAYTLAVTVIMESIVNPRIRLEPWLSKIVETFSETRAFQDPCDEVIQLTKLARLPDIIRHPVQHMDEIKELFGKIRTNYTMSHDRLTLWSKRLSSQGGTVKRSIRQQRVLLSIQTAWGIYLTLGVTSGAMVMADGSADADVPKDVALWRREILKLAEVAMEHRPLGASHVLLCLTAAWASADEEADRNEVGAMIEEYKTDFPHEHWLERCLWLRDRIDSIRMQKLTFLDEFDGLSPLEFFPCGSPETETAAPGARTPQAMVGGVEASKLCCVM